MNNLHLINQPVVGVDYPGDQAFLASSEESGPPALIVNLNASEGMMLSGAIQRLNDLLDLKWVLVDRVAENYSDTKMDGSLRVMGRLCQEALKLCEVVLDKVSERAQSPRPKPAARVAKD